MIRVQTTTQSIRILARESLRKTFSNDLKLRAMNLLQSGLTIAEVSAQMGVEKRNIVHWAELYAENNGESFSPSYYKATGEARLRLRINTPHEEPSTELKELRTENEELRTEIKELRTKYDELGIDRQGLADIAIKIYDVVKERDDLRTENEVLRTKYKELRAANFTINPTDEELRTKYSKILTEHLSAK